MDTASYVSGIAARFGRLHFPLIGDPGTPTPLAYHRRAFADSLRAVRAGRGVVRLLFEHDPDREVCSTRDGTLILTATARALHFYVSGERRAGRRAIRSIRARRDLREVSIGATTRDYLLTADDRMFGVAGVRYVSTATLTEISLVESGACPGTRVRMSAPPRRLAGVTYSDPDKVVRNSDLVLIALARGESPPVPSEVYAALARRGFVRCSPTGPRLTSGGRERARSQGKLLGKDAASAARAMSEIRGVPGPVLTPGFCELRT